MDPLLAAIVSGLVGGGVSGALIGGFVTLRQQRREFDHERRTRFVDLKRERYAGFLAAAEEWFRAQWRQMDVAKEVAHGHGSSGDIPALPSHRHLEVMADEIELLAPPDVGYAADMLVDAIRDLTGFDETNPTQLAEVQDVVSYGRISSQYTLWRNRFVAAAKADLGTD